MVSQQIPFDFARPAPTLENFVAGRNGELIARLRSLDFRHVLYLWGAPSCGKSHLIDAVRHTHGARVIVADDAQALDARAQEALFDAYNARTAAPDAAPSLVVAGSAPPRQLPIREDLRSRLGAGLVFEVHGLSDDEKRAALVVAARERGLVLADDFTSYLLTHFTRDLRSLVGLLDAVDRYALATKRAVTLPLLRELLQRTPLETNP